MKINRRAAVRFSMFAAPVLLGLGVLLQMATNTSAQQTPPAAAAASGQPPIVLDFADKISRLVQNGDVDGLARLSIPTSSAQTSKLRDWTEEYLSQVHLQEKQRDKQFDEACTKAKTELQADHFDRSMASVVLAYRIAKDPDAFLKMDWVKALTDKVSSTAAQLEKDGQWLESLNLYTDLDELYKVDTRFKADTQRLNKRTRLLAVYTPKVLLDMRKELSAKEADPTATKPATTQPEPTEEQELAGFTRWQDYSEKITPDMALTSIQTAQENWVEVTDYPTMVSGGIESLRLFLSTPQLSKEFPALANKDARDAFNKTLDDALAAIRARGGNSNIKDVAQILGRLIDTSNATIKLPKEVIVMEFTDGAIEKLDQFTAMIWPHELRDFDKNMIGKFGGVGIQISLDNGVLKVISPLEDTPAYKAGIEAGDLITAIDGKSTTGITVDQAVNSIMGTPKTLVTLRIKRGNQAEKEYEIQ
ncbi:MAG TPA: PDZ domain-containing protein, partial [Phycisphaerae bacterium]